MTYDKYQVELKKIIYGFCVSQCIYVATRLGIADFLKSGPKPCAELSQLTGAKSSTLIRLLRILEGVGIFSEDESGCFSLTPLSELLQTGTKKSMKNEVLHMLHTSSWTPWGELLRSVITGEAVFPKIFKQTRYDYLAQHPEIGELFGAMATSMSIQEGDEILQHLDLSNVENIVDVRGGEGEFIAKILSHNKGIRGVLFDQPKVVTRADELLENACVSDRCRIESGDFFKEVPKN